MTKQTLKDKYTNWNKAITLLSEREMTIFREMQKLNAEYGDGYKWCSMNANMEGLIKKGYDSCKVYELIAEYNNIKGRNEALREFAIATKNFEI